MDKKSQENWDAGVLLLNNSKPNSAASRIYYSVFEAVLLFARSSEKYRVQANNDKIHRFALTIVGEWGKQSSYYKDIYKDLLDYRITADYDPDDVDKDDLDRKLDDAAKIRKFFLQEAQKCKIQ